MLSTFRSGNMEHECTKLNYLKFLFRFLTCIWWYA